MKKIIKNTEDNNELRTEYEIDYSKVERNPYFKTDRVFVEVDKEVAEIFQSSENINNILKVIAQSLNKNSVATL